MIRKANVQFKQVCLTTCEAEIHLQLNVKSQTGNLHFPNLQISYQKNYKHYLHMLWYIPLIHINI